jgi:uncharacterized protein YycO
MNDLIATGDLLFVVASTDEDESMAIASATRMSEDFTFTHVGIAVVLSSGVYVIDATPSRGVACRSLDDFLSDAPRIGDGIGVVVMQVAKVSIDDAIRKAQGLVGKPYNRYFYPDAEGYYCSQLVYDCYRDEKGSPVFHTVDMNFYDEAGTLHNHWVELFKEKKIPQGAPGTNPNAMAHEDAVAEKLRMFKLKK